MEVEKNCYKRKDGKDKVKKRMDKSASNTRKKKSCDDGSSLESSVGDSGEKGIDVIAGNSDGDTGAGGNNGAKYGCLTAFGDPGNGGDNDDDSGCVYYHWTTMYFGIGNMLIYVILNIHDKNKDILSNYGVILMVYNFFSCSKNIGILVISFSWDKKD